MKLIITLLFAFLVCQAYASTCRTFTRKQVVCRGYKYRCFYKTVQIGTRRKSYQKWIYQRRCKYHVIRKRKCKVHHFTRRLCMNRRVTKYGIQCRRRRFFGRRCYRRKYYVYRPHCRYIRISGNRCHWTHHHKKVCKKVAVGKVMRYKTFKVFGKRRFCTRVRNCYNRLHRYRRCSKCAGVPFMMDARSFYFTASQKRRKSLEQCRTSNLWKYYDCVFDRAHGIIRTQKLPKGGFKGNYCYSWGDPHVRTFYNTYYNVYTPQKKRLLYKYHNVAISEDIAYHPRHWRGRGVNNAIHVTYKGTTYEFKAPVYGRRGRPNPRSIADASTFRFFRGRREGRNYRFDKSLDKVKIKILVNDAGYVSVYLWTRNGNQYGCRGDCCSQKKEPPMSLNRIHAIKFKTACQRKRERYSYCKKRYHRDYDRLRCLKQRN